MVREVDCEQIRELLDGYALGAADSHESRLIEVHVADCVRCWEELSVSNATAALLALSVRIEVPAPHVEQAIMRQAERDLVRKPESAPFWKRLSLSPWPATAGAFGAVSIVALAISGMLLFEVRDMQDRNDNLETQIQAATFNFQQTSALTANQFEEQEVIMAILSDDEHEELEMMPRGGSTSQAFYTWSSEKGTGAVLCEGLPALEPGKVYMLWLKMGTEEQPLVPLISTDGKCQVTMDLSWVHSQPDGIGMTIENAPGEVTAPAKPWFMYGTFPES
jgi:hypothetical protein